MGLSDWGNSRKFVRNILRTALALAGAGLVVFGAMQPAGEPARAAAGINQTINFQGRLLTPGGAVVADGNYNMQFKIYQDGDGLSAADATGSPSGSLKWTETWQNSASNGVVVKNGYFSVALGSLTAFGSSVNWNQDTLWLSMNVGGTSVGASPTYDGEMLPMKRLSSAVYSLNSGQLGGLSSGQYVQLAQGIQSASVTSNPAIGINATSGSNNLITLQSSATDVFDVSSTGNLQFGNNADKTISVATATSGNNGNNLTVQGGSGNGTNKNGGNLVLQGGNSTGSGTPGSVIVKPQTDVATAFQVQKAGGVQVLVVDTSAGQVIVGQASTVNGKITFDNGTNSNTATIYNDGNLHIDGGGNNVWVDGSNLYLNSNTHGNVGINTSSPGDILTVNGNIQVRDADSASKAYRVRTSGSAVDLEGGGAQLYLSVWSGASFSGTQYNQFIFDNTGGDINVQRSMFFATGADRNLSVQTAASGNNGNNLTVQAGSGSGTNKNGGNLVLEGGNSTGSGTPGSVIAKPQTDSTSAFQVQNSSGTSVLNVDTVNQITSTKDLNAGSASNTTGGHRLFSDGFESGDFRFWPNKTTGAGTTITADTSIVRNGKYSAKIDLAGAPGTLQTAFNGGSTVDVRGYVYVASNTAGNDGLFWLCNSSCSNEFLLYRDNATGKLGFYNNGTFNVGSTVLTTGAWHEIELNLTINSSTGSDTVYLDGTSVLSQTSQNTGSSNPTKLYMGDINGGTTDTVYFDDVVVDSVRPGDSSSLSVNDSLHVGGTSSFGGQMAIQATYDSQPALTLLNSDGTTGLEVRSGGSGGQDTFIGLSSGAANAINTGSNYGVWNTGVGYQSLQANTQGSANTGAGWGTLNANTTGNNNTALGLAALWKNTTSSDNTALGYGAMENSLTGGDNTAVGSQALYNANGAQYNTGVGFGALYNIGAGSGNTGFGYVSGANITSGQDNTFIGFNSGYQDSTDGFVTTGALQNASALGYNAQVQASNSLVLGGSSATDNVNVGIGTTIPLDILSVSPYDYGTGTAAVSSPGTTVTGSGTLWRSNMVGEQFVFSNGQTGIITAVSSQTSLTLDTSQPTTAATSYRIHQIGLNVTNAANVGLGTYSPSAKLQVAGNSTDSVLFQANSSSGGVVGQFVANGDVNLGATQTANTVGKTSLGSNNASGYGGIISAQKITTTTGGTVTSASTTLINVDTTPSEIQFGIYADSSGYPGSLMATSPVVRATKTGTITVPITATLSPSTVYWLTYWTNSGSSNNNTYDTGAPANNWYFKAQAWACTSSCTNGMPNTFPAAASPGSYTFNQWLTFEPAAAVRVTGSNGAATFENTSDSSAAFQIQNAAGTSNLFVADTTHSKIGIGTNTPNSYNGELVVATGTSAYGLTQTDGTTSMSTWIGGARGLNGGFLGTDSNSDLGFYANGGSYMALLANGNVNIGRDNSGNLNVNSAALQVRGSGASSSLFKVTDTTGADADVLNIADEGATTFKNRTNSTTGFQIQNAAASNIVTVDTTNGTLNVRGQTSDNSANALVVTDVNGDNLLQARNDGQVVLGRNSTSNSTLGHTSIGANPDTGFVHLVMASKVTTGVVAPTVNSISFYLANTDASPNHAVVGVYSDSSGSPSSRLAQSSSTALSVGWNTISVTYAMSANTTYWLGVTIDAASNGTQMIPFDTGSGTNHAYMTGVTYTGSLPSSFTVNGSAGNLDSMYANITESGAQTTLLTVDPSSGAKVQTPTNTTTAFQVQNASGVSALTVDTTNMAVTTNVGPLTINGLANTGAPTLTSSGTGGSLAAGSYYYEISAYDVNFNRTVGMASSPDHVTTTGSTSKNTLTWSAVSNASGYTVYRSTNGGSTWDYNNVSAGTTSIVDDGSAYTWTTAGGPNNNFNNTGGLNLQSGTSLYLDGGAGNAQLAYVPNYNYLALSNYAAGGGVTLQGDYLNFRDTTGYNNDFLINNSGQVTFKNRSDSTTAFQIQEAGGGTSLMTADTANDKVQFGSTGSTTTPAYLFLNDYSSNTGGSALIVGNWPSPGTWGIGPDSNGSSDYSLRIGNTTFGSRSWDTTQNLNLVVGGTLNIQTASGHDSNTALQVQNSYDSNVLNVDTASGLTTIGNTPGSVQEWDAHATNQATVGVSPHVVGDLMMLAVGINGVNSSGATVSTVSGGGVSSWTKATAYTDATNNFRTEIWEGPATSTGAGTITVTYSATPAAVTELASQEFASAAGTTWSVASTANASNSSSTTVTFPALSNSTTTQLYWGYMGDQNTGLASSGSGFTITRTGLNNNVGFGTDLAPGSHTPTGSQNTAGYSSGAAVMMSSSTTSSALTVSGAASIVGTNSATALQVQNASGAQILGVDTTNTKVTVATTAAGGVFVNNGATLNSAKNLGNFASNGAIGTAAATVDVYTSFVIPQTTSSISLTVPNPTDTTAGRTIYIANTGSTSLTVAGITLVNGNSMTLFWNGSAWTTTAVSTGVSIVGAFSGSSQANGASISGNTITFGPADGTNPGMVSTGTQTFAGAKTFTGAALFKNASNSSTAFAVQNAAGVSFMNIDTTAGSSNLVSNGSFETDTAGNLPSGWSNKGSASDTASTGQYVFGKQSMDASTTAAANDGTKYNITLSDNTAYSLTFYAAASAALSTFNYGYSSDGSTEDAANISATSQTLPAVGTSGWSRFNLSFTTPASHSGTPYLYFKQSDATARHIYLDGVDLEQTTGQAYYKDASVQLNGTITTPLVVQNTANNNSTLAVNDMNGTRVFTVDTRNFRVGVGTVNPSADLSFGATGAGGGTHTINVTAAASGNAGDTLALTANNGNGTNKAGGGITLTSGTGTGNAAGGTIALNTGASATGTTGGITLTTGNASGAGTAGSITLQTGSTASGTAGQVLVQPASGGDSLTAFAVKKSDNTQVLNVDTTNNRVVVGSGSSNAKFYVVGSAQTGLRVNTSTSGDIMDLQNASGATVASALFEGSLSLAANPSLSGAGTVTSNATTAIVGTSTTFTTSQKVGDVLTISGDTCTIASITDATHLTCEASVPTHTGVSYTYVQAVVGSGTITNSASSATINGTTTNFLTAVKAGDVIVISTDGATCTVSSVTSNTQLTCVSTITSAHTNVAYTFTGAGSTDSIQLGANGQVGIGTSATSALTNALTVGGSALFKNASNSTTAFQVQNASSVAFFTVDTTNERVYVGPTAGDTTGALLVLGNKTNAGDPTGVAGAMYYNSSTNSFRCYDVDYWRNCMESARNTFDYRQEFLDAAADQYSVLGGGGAGWSLVASTPSHPGVIEGSTGAGNDAEIGHGGAIDTVFPIGQGDFYRYETDLKTPSTISNATNRYTIRAGFSNGGFNDPGSGAGVDGCILRYSDNINGGKWQGLCGTSTSAQATCDLYSTSGTTVTTSTWYRLTISANSAGTAVTFQVNGSTTSGSGQCQVTTSASIPHTSGHEVSYDIDIDDTVGTAIRLLDVDYLDIYADFGTPR